MMARLFQFISDNAVLMTLALQWLIFLDLVIVVPLLHRQARIELLARLDQLRKEGRDAVGHQAAVAEQPGEHR